MDEAARVADHSRGIHAHAGHSCRVERCRLRRDIVGELVDRLDVEQGHDLEIGGVGRQRHELRRGPAVVKCLHELVEGLARFVGAEMDDRRSRARVERQQIDVALGQRYAAVDTLDGHGGLHSGQRRVSRGDNGRGPGRLARRGGADVGTGLIRGLVLLRVGPRGRVRQRKHTQ